MRRTSLVLAASLAACAADERGAPPMPAPPIVEGPGLTVDEDARDAIVAELATQLTRELEEHPGEVPPMFAERSPDMVRVFVPDAGYEVSSVEPRHIGACDDLAVPVGDGWLLSLTLVRTAVGVGGRAIHEHEGLMFVRREDGALRVYEKIPRDVAATMRMSSARAELWLSPRRYWASLRVDAVVDSDGPFVVLDAGTLLHTDGCGKVSTGARLRAIEVEDARPWAIAGDRLVIATGGRPARIHVELDGLLPTLEGQAETAELSDWMIDLPGAPDVPVALTVFHDADLTLIAGGGGTTIPAPAGWAGVRFEPRDPPIVTLQPRKQAEKAIDIAADRGMSFTVHWLVARCSDRIVELAARLPELGPLPGHHEIVLRSAGTRGDAVWDPRHIAIDEAAAMNLCREPGALEELEDFETIDASRLVLHELAHVWFGGEVLSLDDEAAAVWESLAEYIAIEAMPPAQAERLWRNHRAKLRTDAAAAMGIAQRVNRSGELRNYMSYVAGPLVLRTIADRIGRDTMQEVLRAYLRTNRGQFGSWSALRAAIAQVAGEDAARWADPWLREPFPRVVLKDVVHAGGHLRGTIVVEGSVRSGELAIRLGAHAENPVVQVPFGPTPARFDLPVGDENMIVVDPDDRVPFVLAPEPGRREWDNGGMWFEIEDLVRAARKR